MVLPGVHPVRRKVSTLQERLCAWDGEPIAVKARRDAIYCSKRCRQAAHRFGKPIRHARATRDTSRGAARFGYADPPYPEKAFYYVDHPDYGGEVDHEQLIAWMVDEFPDGWALSTSAEALPAVLSLCPTSEVRVAAWVTGERPGPSYGPLSAWEPVIVYRGRQYLSPVDERRIDALVHGVTARTTDPNWVIGAKPATFCRWMFDLLGALPGDDLVDLFPGSGGVTRAWEIYTSLGDRHATGVASAGGRDASKEYSADPSRTTSAATNEVPS